MKNTLDLKIEYESKAGSRCRIIEKRINWENRKNMILRCVITHSDHNRVGETFETTETSFARDWKAINQKP